METKSAKMKGKQKGKAATQDEGNVRKALKRKSSEDSVAAVLTDVSSVTPKVKKKKKKKAQAQLGESSWEQAVNKARGLPDGNSVSLAEQAEDSRGQKFEKGKKKPLNVIQTAAKKLKKITGKEDGKETPKFGRKRKHDSGESNTGKDSKKKIEELTFKERKKQRKTFKDNHGLAVQAKALWEQLRKHNLSQEKRTDVTNELFELVNGKAKELIFAHDTSRVVQCLIKYGTNEHRNALFEELRDHVLEMTKSKYAKFFVRKLLKYGTKNQRAFVFKSLYGNIRKLIRHSEAAEIVELAYNDFANALQRSSLVEEFYGPSFALFKTAEARTLEEIMAQNPEKRDTILSNMKEALSGLIDKQICQYSIVHRIFSEYFMFATDKARSEMIETVRESLIHMLHTRDGARVAMQCIWKGTAKDRKIIVKSMKTYVAKVCKEEYGHLVLLAIFDAVDDTKLVQKAILEELLKSVDEIAQDQYGRKVLLYLLSPRDHAHFHPDIIRILQEGDSNPTSKKDMSVRRSELLASVSGPLLKYAATHTRELVTNNAALLVLIAIITHTQGDPSAAMQAVAAVAAEPFVAGSLENFHVVEHPVGHLALKRLILHDKEREGAGQQVLFSKLLMDAVSEKDLKAWAACNRGCFILLTLLDLNDEDITSKVRKSLKPVEASLKKMTFKGAQILETKLKDK